MKSILKESLPGRASMTVNSFTGPSPDLHVKSEHEFEEDNGEMIDGKQDEGDENEKDKIERW